MLSNHLILFCPLSSWPQSFPASGSFSVSQLFSSGGQSIGASASASVLPVSIQGWFPLGLTRLISLLSKGLSRVLSNTTVRKLKETDRISLSCLVEASVAWPSEGEWPDSVLGWDFKSLSSLRQGWQEARSGWCLCQPKCHVDRPHWVKPFYLVHVMWPKCTLWLLRH